MSTPSPSSTGSYSGLPVLVFGLGTFGGGVAAARFLAAQGARVSITDQRPSEQLASSLAALADCPLEVVETGCHSPHLFEQAQLVVVNPAIPPEHELLELARAAGARLTSELQLFLTHNPAPVIAVTGSNGKSTTSLLIHEMLQAAGRRSWLGGNIGHSLLADVERIRDDDLVVLELSSFQLHDLNQIRFHPAIAVVTNLTPNHLNWHGSLDAYRKAKQSIYRWQTATDVLITNADDPEVSRWTSRGRNLRFSILPNHGLPTGPPSPRSASGTCPLVPQLILTDDGQLQIASGGIATIASLAQTAAQLAQTTDDSFAAANTSSPRCQSLGKLRLPQGRFRGSHNLSNLAAATCAALTAGAPLEAIQSGIDRARPLPHRMQTVSHKAGRQFINDSLATTIESAVAALSASDRPVVALCGGSDKGQDPAPLVAALLNHAKAVACIGQTGPDLAARLDAAARRRPSADYPTVEVFRTFAEAVQWCCQVSQPGDVVLLSPGYASFGWFANFAERGEKFAQLANEWQPATT